MIRVSIHYILIFGAKPRPQQSPRATRDITIHTIEHGGCIAPSCIAPSNTAGAGFIKINSANDNFTYAAGAAPSHSDSRQVRGPGRCNARSGIYEASGNTCWYAVMPVVVISETISKSLATIWRSQIMDDGDFNIESDIYFSLSQMIISAVGGTGQMVIHVGTR
jgi:hypothetical protein